TIVFRLSLWRPPRSPRFPYTTLFRSLQASDGVVVRGDELFELGPAALLRLPLVGLLGQLGGGELVAEGSHGVRLGRQMLDEHPRSEEHTSELQSRENLVCRLLLEKKK